MSLKPRPAARNAQSGPAVPKETKSEYELAEQALELGADGLQWLLDELRSLSPAFQPCLDPPAPTKEAPRTPEKIRLMAERRRLGYALHHEDDPRLDGMSEQALRATRNMNGSDTEFEAVAIRGFICDRDWKRALKEIDEAKISEAQKELLADEILMRADPDYEMTKRLQRIDEILAITKAKRNKR